MAEVGWEDIQVSANQEFDAIKIGQRLSCMLSYIFIVLTRNEEGAVLPRLVNLGFQVKGLLSENVTSNILLYKFINVVKIIYKEFKDMKEQETLNQEALQQEELEEFEELEVKNKFLGRDCFVTKIFSEIKDLAAIVTEESGVSFSVRLKKKKILGAVENLDAQVLIVKKLLRDSIKNSGQMEIDISKV
ncbi:hypothetical protein GBA52_005833 [Prunus armeniaca]|nr:hypothetical protein GBA52_005833 [Prunus armeniaca]